jgi:hypothetical protein
MHGRIPIARAGVEQVGRGGVGVFVGRHAGEPVVEVVGHHEETRGRLELFGVLALQSHELVEGVEGLALDAAGAVEGARLHDAVEAFGHAFGAGVAVGHRVAYERARAVDEDEVDAPGVDAHGFGHHAAALAGAQAFQDALVERFDVPAVVAVAADLDVVEAVDLFQMDDAVFDVADDVPPARGADVDGQMVVHGHGLTPPSRRRRLL